MGHYLGIDGCGIALPTIRRGDHLVLQSHHCFLLKDITLTSEVDLEAMIGVGMNFASMVLIMLM